MLNIWYNTGMKNSEQQHKMHKKARRREMPVYAGRGAGFHKNAKAYSRKQKHKEKYDG